MPVARFRPGSSATPLPSIKAYGHIAAAEDITVDTATTASHCMQLDV